MDKKFRVLIVEDSASDAKLIAEELRRGRLEHTSKWAKSKDEFLKALGEYAPDIVLCDYGMPGLGYSEALDVVKADHPGTPLIVIADTADEGTTVNAIKLGAADYISKERSGRLVPAIHRALEESALAIERTKAEREIRAAEEIFRNIFNNAIDGILLADIENNKFYIGNDTICRMLGYSKEEIGGLGIADIYPEKDISYIVGKLKHQARGWFHLPGDVLIKRKDGSALSADVDITPIEISGKIYLAGFFHDTAERKTAEEVAMMKKMDKIKTELMSAVSHELCTPLTTIGEFVSIISSEIAGKLTQDQKEYMGIVGGNVDRLTQIINNLLDASKIEYGSSDLKKELVNIANLANAAINKLKAMADEKHVELKTAFPAGAITVYADPDKVVQMFTNLVENAIKFTKESGQVSVEIKYAEKEAICSVSDTGIGINPENLANLFGEFQRFNREFGAGAKGIGLGLAITKGLVEMHNGRIWAESKVGKGSKFTFTLPRYSAKALINNGIEKAAKNGSKMSVIMVSFLEPEKLKQEFSSGKLQAILRDMEGLFEVYMPNQESLVFKDTDRIVVSLNNCSKEGVLMLEGRLEQVLGDYLTHEKLDKKIGLRIGYATYPDEAANVEKLMEKARLLRREVIL